MSLRKLWRDRQATTSLIFAFTIIPLVAMTGAAVDYGMMSVTRTQMQSALDSAALALSKDAPNLTSAQLQTKVASFFNANFESVAAKNIVVTATYTASPTSTTLKVKATATVETAFIGLIGFNQFELSETSTSTWGSTRLRVALVLDNTGSMASNNKMTALKTASKNLLAQLQASSKTSGDVYVSVIPFSKDVNVGNSNVNSNWVRWDLWDAANGYWAYRNGRYVWQPDAHSTWNGCVTDRDQDYDTKNTAPTPATSGTLYPAEQYGYCPVPVLGLTNDWIALNDKIDAMQPNGNTNQAIGLQWGYASLTSGPLGVPAFDSRYSYMQVIILLSDGLNTQNRWTTSVSSIDTRQQKTCDNVKAAGLVIYTIQVNTTGDPTSTLLQGCASDPGKFFLLTSADQIVTTFNQIGTQLSQLRILQ